MARVTSREFNCDILQNPFFSCRWGKFPVKFFKRRKSFIRLNIFTFKFSLKLILFSFIFFFIWNKTFCGAIYFMAQKHSNQTKNKKIEKKNLSRRHVEMAFYNWRPSSENHP